MNSDKTVQPSHKPQTQPAQLPHDCSYDCPALFDFMSLTDELVHTIIDLEEEVIRWRQALLKYLPSEWAEGLRCDILCNLSRDFEGDDAYDFYVEFLRGGHDPQQDEARLARIRRLIDGTDETSITYL